MAAGCAAPKGGEAKAQAPEITPDLRPMGRVQAVNSEGHFVVLSFASGFMPAMDERLGVFHAGEKTGEVKVTGPAREYNIVAEIVSGEPQVADEVKPD